MSTSHATASFYSSSAISTEMVIVDPHTQQLVDEFDHIGLSIPLDAVSGGLGRDDEPNSFELTPSERYLSVYDLCGGDPILVDTILQANTSPLDTTLATPPTSSPGSNDLPFPPPTVGGKWVPGSMNAPTQHVLRPPRAPHAPIAHSPAPPRICPSRRAKNAGRYQPTRTAPPAPYMARSTTSGKRWGRIRTQDYLDLHPANPQDMKRPNGYRAMIEGGRWGPIIVDTLQQIGVPYPMTGLQKVLAELYDGEGEQKGWPAGAKDRPAYPWKGALSWHVCVKKKGYQGSKSKGTFVQLKNSLYPSDYWWIPGRPIPAHCEGFPKKA